MSIKRKWDLSSDEVKKKCLDDIVARLDEMQGEKAGLILAQDVLDIITQAIGPDIYNKGIKDAQKLLAGRFADIDVDLDLLIDRT